MYASFIAIENGIVVANWGQADGKDVDPVMAKENEGREIRKVDTENSATINFPLNCYNADWSLKDEDELRRLGYDEDGNKLPTKEEVAAQAKLQKKREALEAKRDKFAQWYDANENYEQYQLGAVAHTVAQPAVNLSDPLPVQRKK
ncbi:MAG: hypothetical protein AAF975_09610, partial [Spirochaetota bacterium]